MNHLRLVAGVFAGLGALMLIYQGMTGAQPYAVAAGTGLLGTMMGFFVGESNGKKQR